MSSLKMTFSLTSLIFLIALGLVFVPTSVMAHPNVAGQDPADTHATAGHMHPDVMISAGKDVDLETDGIQIADLGTDDANPPGQTDILTLQFDVMVTVPAGATEEDGSTPIAAGTTITANDISVVSHDPNFDAVGAVTLGTIALDDAGTVITVPVTVTLTDSAATPTTETSTKVVSDAIAAGLSLRVTIDPIIQSGKVGGPYMGQDNIKTTKTFTIVSADVVPDLPMVESITAAPAHHGGEHFTITVTFKTAVTEDDFTDALTVSSNAFIAGGSIRAGDTDGKVWKARIEPDSDAKDVMITIKGAESGGAKTFMAAAIAEDAHDVTSNLSGSVLAGKFVVISRSGAIDGFASSVTQIALADLPDLQRFLALRGSITLYGPNKDRDLVISEIMWGRDLNGDPSGDDERDDHQWIELYNSTTADIALSGIQIEFTNSTVVPTATNLIDQFSNIERTGWTVTQGQDGALNDPDREGESLKDLVSMYRNIDYKKVEKGDHDADATKNRNAQLGGIPNGKASGSWLKSIAQDTFALNRIGSPGGKHTVTTSDFDATNVARNAVIITEVGNNGNDDYDWIELTAIAKTNLEKYELQYIKKKDDGTGEVVVLANFVKKDLEAGDILVVLKTDPLGNNNHPIAAGKEWKEADDDREDRGLSSLYHIDAKMAIPNDLDKALFVLRNEKGKTNHENIVDIAGNLFITDTSDAYRTNFWPLRATAAGHGNVIDGDVEDFDSGRVYQRNARNGGLGSVGDGGAHEKDWSVRGFTGIGYKRSATNNGQNGGTPGFDNGAVKEKNTVLTTAGDAGVSISEIMYDRGSRDNLVQWIELYNSSKTLAVNLAGWKLKIENADDVDVREPALTIKDLGGTIIPPNETVLIVAYKRANHSRLGGTTDFPSHRLIDLSDKDELEILPEEKRDYRLLSATAFKITLMEKDAAATAAPVDVAGNLGADGTAMWELPTAMNDGKGRSSIIRRYNEGKATEGGMGEPMMGTMFVWSGKGENKGKMAGDAGWILASESQLSGVHVEHTYYGSGNDVGTPGYRDGGPLPVSLSKFRPERLKETGEIVVRWITESELNNAGFNILRSEKRDGEFTKVHFEAGEGTTSERTVYEWKDTSAKPNVVYYYQIQDVSLDGEVTTLRTTHLRGNVTAAGKAATTWGEIKALQ